jgi:hypothetical protein
MNSAKGYLHDDLRWIREAALWKLVGALPIAVIISLLAWQHRSQPSNR